MDMRRGSYIFQELGIFRDLFTTQLQSMIVQNVSQFYVDNRISKSLLREDHSH